MALFSFNSDKKRKLKQAEELARSVLDQSIAPYPYKAQWIEDTFDARLDWASVHASILINRLNAAGSDLKGLVTPLTESVLSLYDYAFRETGVGDSSIARKIRKRGEQLVGLTVAVSEALASEDGETELAETLKRNGIGGTGNADMSSYLIAVSQTLASLSDEALLDQKTNIWPDLAIDHTD
ncbi:MAG: ubiquinol-cytochrome C chaperone family protein [Pseudomonadota bacterium]